MIRRTSLIAVELIAGLLGVIAIAFAILFWRLTTGPISLAFATPYIERALSVEQPAIDVRIQDTELIWAGWDRAFNIRAANTAILGSGGKVLAILPEVSIGFSVAAMLHGLVAPKRLEIHGLSATVERAVDGNFVWGFFAGKGRDEAADSEFVRQLPGYLTQLTARRDKDSPFGYLRSVRITDVDLQFIDRPRNASWRAPDTDIELLREDEGLEAIASMSLAFEGRSTNLTTHMVFGPDRPTIDIAFDFRNLVPADFARRLPELNQLAWLETPTSGQFRVLAQQSGTINSIAFDLTNADGNVAGNVLADGAGEYDLTAKLSSVRASAIATVFPGLERHVQLDTAVDAAISGHFDAEGSPKRFEIEASTGTGTVEIRGREPRPLKFERLRFKAVVEDSFALARITDAEIDFGGPKVSAEMSAYRLGESYRARLDAKVRNLPMAELERYWPVDLGVLARQWTTRNIRAGVVDEGTIGLVLQLPVSGPMSLTTLSVAGGLRYHDLEVSYFGDLPIVKAVSGTASFTQDRFTLDVTGGKLRDVNVDHGVIDMTKLDTDNEFITIDLVLRGSLGTALAVADSKPLGFVSSLGIDPAKVGGAMAMRFGLRFPLRNDVRTDEIGVAATANLRDVRISPGPFGFDLDEGSLELKLSRGAMKIAGSARLNEVPISLDWHEEFNPKTPFRSRYILSGQMTPAALGKLHLPDPGIVNGPSTVDVIYTRYDDGHGEVLAGGDLKRAVVALPQLGWRKPAGQPGSFNAAVTIGRDGRVSVERLQAKAAGLDLEASVAFSGTASEAWRADVKKLVVGNSDLTGTLSRLADGYAVSVERGRLDLEPLLSGNDREAREMPETETGRLPPVRIDARLADMRISPDGQFRDVTVQALYDGAAWRALDMASSLGGGKVFRMRYGPDGAGHQRFELRSDDAGAALRSLGWSDKMEGGLLTIDGRRDAPEGPLKGSFKLTKYKLTQAPILARLLQVASLTGIFDALGQRGLDFTSFDGTFSYLDGRLTVDKGRAYGSSIGITVEGALDLNEDTADLNGTVVPAYTVNRVLGQIPLLGRILTGGENEGVFAANYAVTGPIEDPVVAVNPLSALAPGFLRKLFDVIGRSDSETKPAPAEPSTPPSQ